MFTLYTRFTHNLSLSHCWQASLEWKRATGALGCNITWPFVLNVYIGNGQSVGVCSDSVLLRLNVCLCVCLCVCLFVCAHVHACVLPTMFTLSTPTYYFCYDLLQLYNFTARFAWHSCTLLWRFSAPTCCTSRRDTYFTVCFQTHHRACHSDVSLFVLCTLRFTDLYTRTTLNTVQRQMNKVKACNLITVPGISCHVFSTLFSRYLFTTP